MKQKLKNLVSNKRKKKMTGRTKKIQNQRENFEGNAIQIKSECKS